MKYECHITCNQQDAEIAMKVAQELHWKTSEIARDPVLFQATYFYLTSHGATFKQLFDRMQAATLALTAAGATVVREKIEDIIYDTKTKIDASGVQMLESASREAGLAFPGMTILAVVREAIRLREFVDGTPIVGSLWRHHNGAEYIVLHVANSESEKPEYPPTVVYQNRENGKVWARNLSDWHRSFKNLAAHCNPD